MDEDVDAYLRKIQLASHEEGARACIRAIEEVVATGATYKEAVEAAKLTFSLADALDKETSR